MKTTLLTLALVGTSAVATFAQGTIQFLNSAISPVKFIDDTGATLNAPTGTRIGIFWGTTRENLTLQTPTATIGATAGVFSVGNLAPAYPLSGANPGEAVYLKFEGWLNQGGATPETIPGGPLSPGITHWGGTQTVQTTSLGSVIGPGTVVWQRVAGTHPNRVMAFTMAAVPEPSPVVIGALGLSALLLRGRRLRTPFVVSPR